MIRCVLFDLDGTTIDTNELIILSVQHVMRQHCGKELSREEIIPQMGGPLVDQLRFFSGREDVRELADAYRTFNYAIHDEMVTLFPGVLATVRRLDEAGVKTGIVTNKMRASTARVLDLFGLAPHIRTVVTIEDVEHPKPHPEPIFKAMQELGVEPGETAMVGDSPFDLLAAKAAGVLAVAVDWSLKPRDVLLESGADRIIGQMEELLGLCGLGSGAGERG